MFKQNSPITRYCLVIGFILAILGPLAQNGLCDFTLTGNQEITVNSTHLNGTLHDTSRAFLVSGANIYNKLWAHDHSTVNMSAGHVNSLYSYEYSTVNISGGDFITGEYPINDLFAWQDSTVNISGGAFGSLETHDSVTVIISNGSVTHFSADNSSSVDISGGSFDNFVVLGYSTMNISGGTLRAFSATNSSIVNISGGALTDLYVENSSTVIFYGQNFNLGLGLDLVGERVLGTGILSGQWTDGTPWSVVIKYNDSSATIRAIPEPATPPIANAGLDQTVTDTDDNGSELVTLNGSGSSDSDGNIVSYVWSEESSQIATEISPTVTLLVGTHIITLTVTDDDGLTDTDTMTVTVEPFPNQPPVANAGFDQTVTDIDDNGSEQVTLNGAGSTDSDGTIQSYVWSEGGTQIATGVNPNITLSIGQHTITLTVTDDDGATNTDTVTITIGPENPSEYPTLYEILGGSAPAIAESGRDFVTLTSPDANLVAFILLESAGFANENVFGIYSAYDPQQKLQLFSGSDSPTDMTTVKFNVTDGNAENLQTGQTANIGKFFGFYLTTPQNGGITYYTDLTRNPDSSEHGLIFNTSGFAGVIENDPDTVIAFEDFLGLGDKDYNDMVVGIINAVPLPGSGPYCIRDIPGDANHDCKVDYEDFAIMASHWLECNLDPQSACWQ